MFHFEYSALASFFPTFFILLDPPISSTLLPSFPLKKTQSCHGDRDSSFPWGKTGVPVTVPVLSFPCPLLPLLPICLVLHTDSFFLPCVSSVMCTTTTAPPCHHLAIALYSVVTLSPSHDYYHGPSRILLHPYHHDKLQHALFPELPPPRQAATLSDYGDYCINTMISNPSAGCATIPTTLDTLTIYAFTRHTHVLKQFLLIAAGK